LTAKTDVSKRIDWRKEPTTRFWGSRREIVFTENLLSHLPRKGIVLDAGCGDGYLSYLLANRGLEVVGADFSSFRIKYAHEHCAEANFVLADGRHLPFCSGYFSSVVCCEVLEHVPDYPLIVDELFRVTKSKGELLATVPNKMPEHVNSFDQQKIYSLIRKGGYEVRKIYGIGFELEGVGKRFPSRLRVLVHRFIYAVFRDPKYLLVIGFKS
jgi:2-polyprenyl-3-methyl-5-hydroxy-6-metoxy-1,4-benzoquinol methylase